jgi:hypothetical protein
MAVAHMLRALTNVFLRITDVTQTISYVCFWPLAGLINVCFWG